MTNLSKLNLPIDAVVMLTGSYYYATGFSQIYPVILVQADLTKKQYSFEQTEIDNIIILHVSSNYSKQIQTQLIAEALNSKGIIAPLLWIDNPRFIEFIASAYSPYKIFYVSEDYLNDHNQNSFLDKTIFRVLNCVDKIICASRSVQEFILNANCKVENKIISISNFALDKDKLIQLSEYINSHEKGPSAFFKKLNILILYEGTSVSVGTIKDHVNSFGKYSEHRISYENATAVSCSPDFSKFDIVVIHYSLRVSVSSGIYTLSNKLKKKLKKYPSLKILFIQDEYDCTHLAIEIIKDLGIQLVFSCVPEDYIEQVYPKTVLPCVKFVNVLTGYVCDSLVNYPVRPISARTVKIAYRGRNLPYWYGTLGQEKEYIGRVLKDICNQKKITEDIEWDCSKRIYGDDWLLFLSSAKATLGTESGSNVFDFDGQISKQIRNHLLYNPEASFKEVFDLFLVGQEDKIKMNQISPKLFEAICLRTALILFEGSYSNILIPNRHYIPLKKDFSNVEEVLEKVNNDEFLEKMTTTSFNEIVLSANYSYERFIRYFDSIINQTLCKKDEKGCMDNDEVKAVFEKTNLRFIYTKMLLFVKRTVKALIPMRYIVRIKSKLQYSQMS